ncbi:MAG: TetR/AcrR family transcriptional regulator [Novosphingobium sp.]
MPQDSQTSKEAILKASLQAFARDGYDGASLPKIARLANVAPPLIHYYFGSKDQLWRATVDFSLGELRREAASISLATRSLAPLDRLRVLLQAHVHFAAKWPDHFFMIVAEARTASERYEWLQDNYTGVLFEDVVAVLRDARESGAIRDVCLDQLAILLIGGILVYFTVYPRRPTENIEKDAEGFADMMFDLFFRGVVIPDPKTASN